VVSPGRDPRACNRNGGQQANSVPARAQVATGSIARQYKRDTRSISLLGLCSALRLRFFWRAREACDRSDIRRREACWSCRRWDSLP